jgi:O-acetyl-ADP-ribose deacetylase (regulator of RNase III)
MVDAWRNVFDGYSGIEISCGDIFDLKADAIVSPANSFGFMNGGIDGAYSRHFGQNLQKVLQKTIREEYYGEIPVGNAVIISTRDINIKYLISAPTMRVPQNISETVNAYLAFRAALIEVKKFNEKNSDEINSILCPGMGTLTGGMTPKDCAIQMRKAYDAIFIESQSFPVASVKHTK